MQDVYQGPGLAGVERGAVRALRVVALEFRAAGIGSNSNRGPAGGAMASTPVSIQGTWDVKKILGTAPVYEDGSACFVVPARTPVYFQALDANGHAAQTMRSWTTLQPGESVSCVGCHEGRNTAPPAGRMSLAMKAGPRELTPWQGPPRGFSFAREIQPILDRHCVRCHHLDTAPVYAGSTDPAQPLDLATLRTLVPPASGPWRCTTQAPPDEWAQPGFDDSAWPSGAGGFGRKGTPGARIGTPWQETEIWIRRTFEFTADSTPGAPGLLVHHDEDTDIYVNGVLAARVSGFTKQYEVVPMTREAVAALRVGPNTLAARCRQTSGGQFIDVGLVDTGPPPVAVAPPPEAGVRPAFSLRDRGTLDPRSLRRWSDAYKALANRNVANWINVQSAPSMLPPYGAGAARSKLITMLADGHNGVKLSPEEMDRIAAWIDLLVPFCGDYTDGLEGGHLAKYERFLRKREAWDQQEAQNIRELLRDREPRP